ncbi:MAG TPA: cysteate synthase [Bacteroidales bacterium]|nr:cysteate synthase [Bacteroidales bacterium]HSA44553.1 cysteate synthase [Bacteroidales bacterium]
MNHHTTSDLSDPAPYHLESVGSGAVFPDHDWMLDPPDEPATLLRAVYERRQLRLRGPGHGLYTFADWLPLRRQLQGSAAPVSYRSSGLAGALGLDDLWITFSGYWPERAALMRTCSFKETEAFAVCGRLKAGLDKVLVVASAGNTARSFARVCSDNGIPLLLCIPEENMDALWFDKPLAACVKVLATAAGSDYYDAIHLSNLACRVEGFLPEGGARNVARRDGMGTTVLSAVTTAGRIPDYYFQAVGSGTGAIAAWEANLRLIADGRFGHTKMKLMLSQNAPFQPMTDAWRLKSRQLPAMDEDEARRLAGKIDAKVLSNRKPPYSVRGGLFDALSDAGGQMLAITNDEARKASSLFQEKEGIDIHPAAAVAVASLIQALENGDIGRKTMIMLNITGGGEAKFKETFPLIYAKAETIIPIDPEPDFVREILIKLDFS